MYKYKYWRQLQFWVAVVNITFCNWCPLWGVLLWLLFVIQLTHPQVMYCSSECRQAAADQYHRVLCLGPSQEDPDHPVNKLKDAWRWDIIYELGELNILCFLSQRFDLVCWKQPLLFRSMHYPPETSSIMLMARMVAVVKQVRRFWHHWGHVSLLGFSLAST